MYVAHLLSRSQCSKSVTHVYEGAIKHGFTTIIQTKYIFKNEIKKTFADFIFDRFFKMVQYKILIINVKIKGRNVMSLLYSCMLLVSQTVNWTYKQTNKRLYWDKYLLYKMCFVKMSKYIKIRMCVGGGGGGGYLCEDLCVCTKYLHSYSNTRKCWPYG